ncbi:MAG: glycosyltransferase family 2 protein [Pyrinomonadaceae bacterium]
MLEQITPLILTYNEAPNIGRTLEKLCWARDIVVVDSFSDDETLEIVSRFPQVRIFQRKFDTHQRQWNFGLHATEIKTDWTLALDADYVLTQEMVDELAELQPSLETCGYRAKFTYCVNGSPLRSGLYPPVTILYRRVGASYEQDGHTQRLSVEGQIIDLSSPILHDDRKPLSRWFKSQQKYTRQEAEKLLVEPRENLSWTDRVRQMRILAPGAMLFYCLIVRRGILDGKAGFDYAFQRMIAEAMLSVQLLEHDLATREGNGNGKLVTGNGVNGKRRKIRAGQSKSRDELLNPGPARDELVSDLIK